MSKNIVKVRVTYKYALFRKTGVMQMTDEMIKFYRSENGKKFSPYSKIVVLKK
jgi:hypothetical protein